MAVRLSEIFVEISARTAKLRKGLSTASAQFQKLGVRVSKFSQENKVELAAFSAVGILAFKNLLTVAGDFEASMKRVQAVSGATGEEFKALEAKARELGETTQFSASQAAAGMEFLAKAGFDANKVLEAIPFTLQLAASASLDLGQAADIVTNIMAGFNLETKELGRVNDVLVKAFTSSNVNLIELGEAMKLAGPVALTFGQNLEDTVAILGSFGDAGFKGSLGGTALRGAMIRLATPSKEVEKIFTRVGLSVFDTTGEMRPLLDILEDLENSTVTAGEKFEIFGQRAGPAIASLLARGISKTREFGKTLRDSAGTAARIAAVQMEGFRGASLELSSAFEGLKIAIATSGLLQFATKFARGLANIIREVARFSPALLGAFALAGAAATVLATSLAVLGFLGPAIATGFGLLVAASGSLATVWVALNATVLGTTITLAGVQTALAGLLVSLPAATVATIAFVTAWGPIILTVGLAVAVLAKLTSQFFKLREATREATEAQRQFEEGQKSVQQRINEGFTIAKEFEKKTLDQARAMGTAAAVSERLSLGIAGLTTALEKATEKGFIERTKARIEILKRLRTGIGTVADEQERVAAAEAVEAAKATARVQLETQLFRAQSDVKRDALRNQLEEAKSLKDEALGAEVLRKAQLLELETQDSEAFKEIIRDKTDVELEELIRLQNAKIFGRELDFQARIESDAAKVAQETATRQKLALVANKTEALITGFFNKNLTAREKKAKAFRTIMSAIQGQITKRIIAGIAAQSAAETAGAVVQTAAQKPVIAAKFFKAFAGLPFVGQALAIAAITTAFAFIGRLANFNKGGLVPGRGTKDTVPAMLTPGEFVLTRGMTRMLAAGGAGGGMVLSVKIFNPIVDSDERLDQMADEVGDRIMDRLSLSTRGVIL